MLGLFRKCSQDRSDCLWDRNPTFAKVLRRWFYSLIYCTLGMSYPECFSGWKIELSWNRRTSVSWHHRGQDLQGIQRGHGCWVSVLDKSVLSLLGLQTRGVPSVPLALAYRIVLAFHIYFFFLVRFGFLTWKCACKLGNNNSGTGDVTPGDKHKVTVQFSTAFRQEVATEVETI